MDLQEVHHSDGAAIIHPYDAAHTENLQWTTRLDKLNGLVQVPCAITKPTIVLVALALTKHDQAVEDALLQSKPAQRCVCGEGANGSRPCGGFLRNAWGDFDEHKISI